MYHLQLWHNVGGYKLHAPNVTLEMAKSLLEYQRKFNRTRTRIIRVSDMEVIEEYIP